MIFRLLALTAFGYALSWAAPPSCKTEQKGEVTLEACERDDHSDDAAIKEQMQNPSASWMGCMWPAHITSTSSQLAATDSWYATTYLALVARYRDSERMDITTTFEQKDHTFRKDVQKDETAIFVGVRLHAASASLM
jgi:hypothetical protein